MIIGMKMAMMVAMEIEVEGAEDAVVLHTIILNHVYCMNGL